MGVLSTVRWPFVGAQQISATAEVKPVVFIWTRGTVLDLEQTAVQTPRCHPKAGCSAPTLQQMAAATDTSHRAEIARPRGGEEGWADECEDQTLILRITTKACSFPGVSPETSSLSYHVVSCFVLSEAAT